jgi:hypothetical protein
MRWEFLLLIGILVVIFIIIWWYSTFQSSKFSQISFSENSDFSGNRKGDLYDECPCLDELVCDSGICKKPTGSSCTTTSSCESGSLCYMGTCTTTPTTQEEIEKTSWTLDQICVNRHFLKYSFSENRFIPILGWWSLDSGIGICHSSTSGHVFVLTNFGLWNVAVELGHKEKITVSGIPKNSVIV